MPCLPAALAKPLPDVFNDEQIVHTVPLEGESEYFSAEDLTVHSPGGVEYDPLAPSSGWLKYFFGWMSSSGSTSSSALPPSSSSVAPARRTFCRGVPASPAAASNSSSVPPAQHLFGRASASAPPAKTTSLPSIPVSTADVLNAATTVWKGVEYSVIIEAALVFLKVVLRRMFPLRRATVDKWVDRIEGFVGKVGMAVFIASFVVPVASGGVMAVVSQLPLMAVVALASLLTSWAVQKASERYLGFVIDLVDKFREFAARLLRCTKCPEGLIAWLWQGYGCNTRLKVGKCWGCEQRPPNTLNPVCGHTIFCQDCIEAQSHCFCGKQLANKTYQVPSLPRPCPCGECIAVALCGACNARPCSVINLYRSRRMGWRCNHAECRDSAAARSWEIHHQRDSCPDPVVQHQPNEEERG
ncbi:hypothetical protein QOT17_017335 [Balamuthia mandrillaris]